MIKVIGALLIVFSTTITGVWLASGIKKRIRLLETMAELSREVGEEIRYRCTPTGALLKSLLQKEKYAALSFLCSAAADRRNCAALMKLAAQRCPLPLTEEDRQLIGDFFAGLGRSDREGQKAHCEAFHLKFAALTAAQREDALKRAGMINSLGFLSGVFLTIFIL